jgi:GGDEF domain-containing protein
LFSDAWDQQRALKRYGQHEFVLLSEEMEAAETLYASESFGASHREVLREEVAR